MLKMINTLRTLLLLSSLSRSHTLKRENEMFLWEQLEIAAQYQNYWADNAVSVTISFKGSEADQIRSALEMYETRLKAVSFLKYEETGYEQAPYESITKEKLKRCQPKLAQSPELMMMRAVAAQSFVQTTRVKYRRNNVQTSQSTHLN